MAGSIMIGYGYGDGDGDGSGDGEGEGYGDGSSYGPGYGSGDGVGVGDGGDKIGVIGDYAVLSLAPWPYVRAGCECHSIEEWRAMWRAIARRHGVDVEMEEAEVIRLLSLAERGRNTERKC